ncbi:hypothetical protein D3C84_656710 [compost metagenome]
MGVAVDVLVQAVHELPALLLAHGLQPARDAQVAGAGGAGVGHDHLALVDGLGEIGPAGRRRYSLLLCLYLVEADGAEEGVQTNPVGLGLAVTKTAVELLQPLGGVTGQHLLLIELHQAGGGQSPHHIGLGLGFLRQQPGCDHPGGVTHPLDVDIRVLALKCRLQLAELLRLEGGVDGEIGRGQCRGCHGGQHGGGQQMGSLFHPLLHFGWLGINQIGRSRG